MTTLLDHIDNRAAIDAHQPSTDVTAPARRLRATMAAVRLSFTWLGTQKSLTPEQRAQAAEAFDAEGQFLSAGKKLIDVKHPAFRAVTAIPSTGIKDSFRSAFVETSATSKPAPAIAERA